MNNSAIMCDEIIERTVPKNLNENKVNCKTFTCIFLIAIVLLIGDSAYCYLIKYRAKKTNIHYHLTLQIKD